MQQKISIPNKKNKKVDPKTGQLSDAPNAVSYSTYRGQQKVDPKTGKRSDAPNAITFNQFRNTRKVDPESGKPSDAEDAITYSAFKRRKKVDPETGLPSKAANAVPYSIYSGKKKYDPKTGKLSEAPDAVSYSTFKGQKKVDSKTGRLSDAPDAITYIQYLNNKKVDPKTGKPSDAEDAITYSAFKRRKTVDPSSGLPSDALDAIPYSTFIARQKVDPDTGQPSNAANAVPYSTFVGNRKVDPKTGQLSNAPDAVTYNKFINDRKVDPNSGKPSDGSDAITKSALKRRKKVKLTEPSQEKCPIMERSNTQPISRKRTLDGATEYDSASKRRRLNNMSSRFSASNEQIDENVLHDESNDNVENALSNESMTDFEDFRSHDVRDSVSETLHLSADESYGAKLSPARSSFGLFAIKSEVQVKVEIQDVIHQLRQALKNVRKDSNVQNNCGYLTDYTIVALRSMLHGNPIPSYTGLEVSSLPVTPNEVTFRFAPIKLEDGTPSSKQLRVATSVALPHSEGLHANLPLQPSTEYHLDSHDNLVPAYFEETSAPRMRVKAAELSSVLQQIAAQKQRTLIGHIALARKGRHPVGHVFPFCATPHEVFYLDGQLYDGVTQQGDPVFKDITKTYSFSQQVVSQSEGEFIDDVFFLIHHEMQIKYREFNEHNPSIELSCAPELAC